MGDLKKDYVRTIFKLSENGSHIYKTILIQNWLLKRAIAGRFKCTLLCFVEPVGTFFSLVSMQSLSQQPCSALGPGENI